MFVSEKDRMELEESALYFAGRRAMEAFNDDTIGGLSKYDYMIGVLRETVTCLESIIANLKLKNKS